MALSRPAIRASATKSKIVLKPNSSQAWCRTVTPPKYQAAASWGDSAATKLRPWRDWRMSSRVSGGQGRDVADRAGARALWGTKGLANQIGEVGGIAALALGGLDKHTCYIKANKSSNARQI